MIPRIVESLSTDPSARKYAPGSTVPASNDDGSELSTNFSDIFKQLFCVAAQRLANEMHEPLEDLGVLFEEPLETGTFHLSRSSKIAGHPSKFSIGSRQSDLERDAANVVSFGRGKYLFLNRRLTISEADRFAVLGYRFGSTQQISDLLARTMEVPQDLMKGCLDRMKLFSSVEHLPPPGVYIACFMLRPSVHQSFDVLVPSESQGQLPLISLQSKDLNAWQSALLERFDEWTVKEILKTLINESGCLDLERDFRWQLHSSLIRLFELVGEFDHLMNAKFSAKPAHIPCSMTLGTAGPMACTLLTIRLMNTIHSKPQKDTMVYLPLSFFSAQQQVDSLHPNHEAFARRIQMEFGYLPCQKTDTRLPRASLRSSRCISVHEGLHDRLLDSEVSTPTHLFKFKHPLRPLTPRKSEESSMIRVDTAVSEEKSGSEMEDMDTVVASPTPPGGIPTDYQFHQDQQDRGGNYEHRLHSNGQEPIELAARSTDDNANWVQELFGLFGLGPGPRARA